VSREDAARTAQTVSNHSGESSKDRFEAIYAAFAARILRLAYRFTHNEETSRDLTQEIFMKVYEHLGDFRGEAGEYTWIHRIAVNHMLNYLRKERRNRWYDIMDEKITTLVHAELSGGSKTPDRVIEEKERERIIWSAIESLGPKYRIPFILFRFEEMSYTEIADSMNISLSAVEARIHRAKKQLIRELEPWLAHI
jgi:RNA polymerase sigma-70 factor (ECF subfamily)